MKNEEQHCCIVNLKGIISLWVELSSFCILTLHLLEEHLNPPPLVQGSLKETFTDTFKAFVKDDAAEMSAVGEIVSAEKGQQS